MNLEAQIWIVAGIIALAAAYVARQSWRTWNPRPGAACGGCGCAKTEPAAPAAQRMVLTIKRRYDGFSIGKPASHQPR